MDSERIPCGLCRRVKRANMMKIIPYIKNPCGLATGILKYITLIFIFSLWLSNVFAYQVNKTSVGADIKWVTSDVLYYINPSGGPSGNLSAIQASMQTWTDVGTSSFTFLYGGTTTNTAFGTDDGANIVCFGSMGYGILAENRLWFYTNSGQIIDSDIKFNTNYTWATNGSSGAYDVQNVGTHELGHSLSLADLYNAADSEKTMYGYASAGETKKRTLHQDDIDGITYLYPDTTPPTGTITINSGASYTKATDVTLLISCADTEGSCTQMQFSNDNSNWSTPESFATTKAWTLTSGDGTKTVSAKFKDNAGNWSIAYSDSIVLDTVQPATTTSPPGGTYGTGQSVSLVCDDGVGSGCGNIYYTTDGSNPTTQSSVYSGSIIILANTTLKFFALDLAGNQETFKTETYITGISPLTITTSSLPYGTLDIPYNQTLTATGGTLPYSWSVISGTLPDGLTLNSSTGIISGTPAATGDFNFSVQVTDGILLTAVKQLSVTITQTPPVMTSSNSFSTIQAAYDTCSTGTTIQIQAIDFDEYLYFGRDISITLKGGYDADYTSNLSYTTISGSLTISQGTVVLENIVIQ
jgi:hypothetical protein